VFLGRSNMPSILNLGVAFWFFTAVLIVCFMVHIMCQNHKLRTEKELSQEQITRMFYNSVTRKLRKTQRKDIDLMDAYATINSAKGSFEVFERIYNESSPSLASIIGTTSDGLTLDSMHYTLSQQEDFLRAKIIQLEKKSES
jgi:hypothetical protein